MNDVLITLGAAASQTFTYGGLVYNVVGDPANAGGSAAPIVADLVDLDSAATGISFFQNQGFNKTTSNGVAQDGTGGAYWVKADPSSSGWFSEAGEVRIFGYGNLDPTHTYRVEGFSSRDITGTRNTAWTIGATTLTINAAGNSSVTAIFTGVAPDGNNQILITTEEAGGDAAFAYTNALRLVDEGVSISATRKGSTFDIETTLSGTVTSATLNAVNVFDHVTGQVGTTVSFAGAATDEITTSGQYTLTLGDGTSTENITVQVNVYGVAPSNNPLQKDGAALASLTGVQVRVTDGANLNGTELYYSGTATTDASGNLASIDLSSTAVVDADPVLLHMRTAAGDSIIASETVGLI